MGWNLGILYTCIHADWPLVKCMRGRKCFTTETVRVRPHRPHRRACQGLTDFAQWAILTKKRTEKDTGSILTVSPPAWGSGSQRAAEVSMKRSQAVHRFIYA